MNYYIANRWEVAEAVFCKPTFLNCTLPAYVLHIVLKTPKNTF